MKAAVAEIQLIREAALQFKHNDGEGTYNNMTLAAFGSYLGDGIAQEENRPGPMCGVVLNNIFGRYLFLNSAGGGSNLNLTSNGIPNVEICKRILEHFREIQEVSSGGSGATDYYIP